MSEAAKKPWENPALAPNGKPISENFATWFNDSVLVGSDGQPVVVYRGDKDEVTSFERGLRREHGLFFAIEKERAEYYGPVHAYVLKATNPLDLRDTHGQWRKEGPVKEIVEQLFEDHYKGDHSEDTGEPYTVGDVIDGIENGYLWKMESSGGFQMRAWRALQALAEAYDFDAIIVPDDGEGAGVGIDYVVFQAEQVKCLDRNSGLFVADSRCSVDVEAAALFLQAGKNDGLAIDRAQQALEAVNELKTSKASLTV